MAINWSDIFSPKVRDGLRVALKDRQLSHEEAVDLLQSVLNDGELTGIEMNDLHKIARTATTIPWRSKDMLVTLGNEVLKNLSYSPFYFSTSNQKYAVKIVCDFLKRSGPQSFTGLNRNRVGVELLLRIANPNIINQRDATVCGPVAFLYGLALNRPAEYANFAIQLFEKGRASVKKLDVSPGKDCRSYVPPEPLGHTEWLTAASLRDSENFFFDFEDIKDDGGTDVKELAKWIERAGYSDIHKVIDFDEQRTEADLKLVNDLYNRGYMVALVISANLLYAGKQGTASSIGDHWVVLRSPINVVGPNVSLTVYTWGQGQRKIPEGQPISKSGFLGHWYSYIAAKP